MKEADEKQKLLAELESWLVDRDERTESSTINIINGNINIYNAELRAKLEEMKESK